MARQVSQRELRNQSGEIMRGLDDGERFIVTRRGVPVGELTPVGRKRTVSTAALLEAFTDVPAIGVERLREDLDAVAEQDPTPRA